MKKLFIAASVAAAVTASASTFADGLTLSSHGATKNIIVYCGQNGVVYPGLFPIPANGSLPTLGWNIISGMFHGQTLQCTFVLQDGKPASAANTVGKADLTIAANNQTAEITNDQEFLGYTANISVKNEMSNAISVALQGPAK